MARISKTTCIFFTLPVFKKRWTNISFQPIKLPPTFDFGPAGIKLNNPEN
jgi:hypothetical protein